ncbi:hypothetical protein R6Q59_023161 [Mikania micrantha]
MATHEPVSPLAEPSCCMRTYGLERTCLPPNPVALPAPNLHGFSRTLASFPRHNVVSVVHLGVHFINVTLKGYYPMPTVNPIWKRYRNDAASDCEFVYHDRLQEYQRFVDENKLVDYIDV